MGEEKPSAVYDIDFLPAASRQFRKLPGDIQKRIEQAVLSLRTNPRPPGVKKLRAQTDRYRIRVGSYRVIYEKRDQQLVVLVVDVGHRKDIYRD